MRLAVLSDIHGNLFALEAVLSDLKAAGGSDRTWILGDLATGFSRPAECMKIIRDLKGASPDTVDVIGGNVDRYLVTGYRRSIKVNNAEEWATFGTSLRERERLNLFVLDRIGWEDAETLLKAIRKELELEVPGYGWLIGFHAAPGNDEQIILPETPDHEVLDTLSDSEGRLAFGGHTHKPMDRDLGRWRMVNPGSVGMPLDGDPRASYALVRIENGQAQVENRRITYDIEAAVNDLYSNDCPEPERMAQVLRTGKGP